MESDKKVEMIQKAIRKLMEEEEINVNTSSPNESPVAVTEDEKAKGHRLRHNRRRFLSKLLSELDSLEQDNNDAREESGIEKTHAADEITKNEAGNSSNEEIMKELKNINSQNTINHHLLTALVMITLAWQLSEVSLILKIKDGLNNPLRSIGQAVKGFFGGPPQSNAQDAIKQEQTSLPGIKIPELQNLLGFDESDDEDD